MSDPSPAMDLALRCERTALETAEDERIVRQFVGDVSFTYVDTGWTSRVYLVGDGATVVKFPRDEAARLELAREIETIRALGSWTGNAALPRLRAVGEQTAFAVYDGIVGTTLDDEEEQLTTKESVALGRHLGELLLHLHQLEVPGSVTVSIAEEISDHQRKFELARAVLERSFDPADLARLEAFEFSEYPSTMAALGGERGLCHGDLGRWNLIVTVDHRIDVIDFGDAAQRDPAIDFVGIPDDLMRTSALDAYGADNHLRAKVAIRRRALPLAQLMFHVGLGDDEGAAECVVDIRNALLRSEPETPEHVP